MRYLRKFNESGNMSEYISDVGHIQFDYNFLDVGVLKGKIIEDIVINREKTEIILSVEGSGFYEFYKFYHQKDCCESVWIEDIEGDLNDLLGYPILQAEKITEKNKNNSYESSTWTFYKLATKATSDFSNQKFQVSSGLCKFYEFMYPNFNFFYI